MSRTRSKNDLAHTLAFHCKIAGLPPHVDEHRFHEKRRWHFDLAWPERKLAVEVHGGTFSRGGHNRGLGMARDAEKQRAAVIHGWRVLTFTQLDLKEPAMCTSQIKAALIGTMVEFPIRDALKHKSKRKVAKS